MKNIQLTIQDLAMAGLFWFGAGAFFYYGSLLCFAINGGAL
jgi:hypothetical protein